jgi:hypothetical protein
MHGQPKMEIEDVGLSREELESAIMDNVEPSHRKTILETIFPKLRTADLNRLSNTKLASEVGKLIDELKIPGVSSRKVFDPAKIRAIQADWRGRQPEEGTKFIFKASDLQSLPPENLIRFELNIDVS